MKQEKTAYMGEVYLTKRQTSPVELHPVPTELVLASCKNERARKVEPNNTEASRGLAVPATVSAVEVETLKSEVFTG
ncbi:hypothetical protein CY34DRAFT_808282 [Suillus luteus UH-Slu-Lm8-n1]|uniref:Uncharacterized protein n=1 Tax=Suillus luteus UH-Slu-Lm8-n1 TaxID=930992 RepID=A0A0D0AYR2_9AGAM|nr:hypothetical protein CY34DRAFT_808282 [Suillus luteus UH-Slu-Lm8-n1]